MASISSNNAPNAPEKKRRGFLSKLFNRKNAVRLAAVAFVVDQYGYAGKYGNAILDSNSFTRPAAPYYRGAGTVLNFGWESLKDLGHGLNQIVQGQGGRYPNPR